MISINSTIPNSINNQQKATMKAVVDTTMNALAYAFVYNQNREHSEEINYIKCYGLYSEGNVTMNMSLDYIKNTKKLNDIAALPANWNENNAKTFSEGLIKKCRNILELLSIQPEIFPTAAESIQMEYEKDNGEYLEFNVYENCVSVYRIFANDEEEEYLLEGRDEKNIIEVVKEFYARN